MQRTDAKLSARGDVGKWFRQRKCQAERLGAGNVNLRWASAHLPSSFRQLSSAGMPGLSILAAALMIAPQPNLRMQIRPEQYPRAHLAAGHSAAAVLEFVVSPTGKIENCRVLSFEGNEGLAHEMCRLQLPHSWRAANGERGEPAYGVVRILIKMTIPGTPDGDRLFRFSQAPEFEITVKNLPRGVVSPIEVKVELKVNGEGTVLACRPNMEDEKLPALGKVACDQAMDAKIAPASNRSGVLDSFIIEQRVRFKLADETDSTAN